MNIGEESKAIRVEVIGETTEEPTVPQPSEPQPSEPQPDTERVLVTADTSAWR